MKAAKFLGMDGSPQANDGFLLEYQKGILLSLRQQGLLNDSQLAEAIQQLETQFQKQEDS